AFVPWQQWEERELQLIPKSESPTIPFAPALPSLRPFNLFFEAAILIEIKFYVVATKALVGSAVGRGSPFFDAGID
ncbi:MAG: hypothetical protein WCD69_01625, partial [Xanthobacteraceae bacterium]